MSVELSPVAAVEGYDSISIQDGLPEAVKSQGVAGVLTVCGQSADTKDDGQFEASHFTFGSVSKQTDDVKYHFANECGF